MVPIVRMGAEVQIVVGVLSEHVHEARRAHLFEVKEGAMTEGEGGISTAKAVCGQVVEDERKVLVGNGDGGAGRKEWGSTGGDGDEDITFGQYYQPLHSSQY